MKYTAKIIKVGSSLYTIVPANIKNMLKLKQEDIVEIDLSKIIGDNMKSFRCKRCNLIFDNDDDIPYCTSCNCKNLEEIKE
tara:strand:+ start:2385 stop:2627 length:243 start_codon:yes stop_codon:yes gene_type:complete